MQQDSIPRGTRTMLLLQPGTILDNRYEILGILGRGGMGCVYKAHQLQIQRTVAIKVPSEAVCENEGFLRRFVREAQACARVAHDHIVAIYDVHAGDHPYIVMEFVDGMPLSQFLHDQATALFVSDLLRLVGEIAEGLEAAHRAGVVHRDIKPANIVVTHDSQRAKIMDFGIARVTEDTALTMSGSLMGTPYYMAPEQIQGHLAGPEVDQYALAGIVYQIFTGHLPFKGPVTTLLYRHLHEAPIPPSQRNPSLPTAIDQVILRSLSKAPEERYRSVMEFHRELRLALRSVENLPYSQVVPIPDDETIASETTNQKEIKSREANEKGAELLRALAASQRSQGAETTEPPPGQQSAPSGATVDPMAPTIPLAAVKSEPASSPAESPEPAEPAADASAPPPSARQSLSHLLPTILLLILIALVAIPMAQRWRHSREESSAAPDTAAVPSPPPASEQPLPPASEPDEPGAVLRWVGPAPTRDRIAGEWLLLRWQGSGEPYRVELSDPETSAILAGFRTIQPQAAIWLETAGRRTLTITPQGGPGAEIEAEFRVLPEGGASPEFQTGRGNAIPAP